MSGNTMKCKYINLTQDIKWCSIENDHKIEITEDRATRILSWMHFSLQTLLHDELYRKKKDLAINSKNMNPEYPRNY